MGLPKRPFSLALLLAAAVLPAPLPCAAAAPDAPSQDQSPPEMTPRQMAEEIRRLEARIAQLEARRRDEPTAAEVDAVVERVMRDAEARSRLFNTGDFGITYSDGKLIIANADKSFLFHPWAHLQVRNSTNWRDSANPDGSDDTQNGFEIRRLRFGVDGTLFTDFAYLFNIAAQRANTRGAVTNSSGQNIGSVTNSVGGVPVVEEAWVLYHFPTTPWYVRAGQFHDPLGHEPNVSSKFRDLEASLTTDVFANTDEFTQGATLVYDPKDHFRVEGGLTDGIRSANTSFQDYPDAGVNYDFGVAARAEYKAMGRWQDYGQMTALGNQADLLVFGLGNDFSEGGSTNAWTHTLDVQYALPSGLFLYGAAWGRYITNNPGIALGGSTSTSVTPAGTPGLDTYEYAFEGQIAYLVKQKWEPYFRYEYLWVQGTPAGSDNGIQDFTLGLNYYIHGHNAKLTTRLMFLPDGIPFDDTGNDVLSNNGKSEFIFSEQLQLIL